MPTREDRIRGALYGQAIGDALGIPGEFKSSKALALKYGEEGPHGYEHVSRQGGASWKAGEWSDDTEQALCIIDAWLIDKGELRGPTLAEQFCKWAETNGRGMGNHTWNVLSSGAPYLIDPVAVSKAVWEDSGRNAAANGAVMRTSAVGILIPDNLDYTEEIATLAAQTTHYDPRCVASSVAVSVTIAKLVTGASVEGAVLAGIVKAENYHPEVRTYAGMSLSDLELDEGMDNPNLKGWPPIGYTYKCLGAGFWALQEAKRLFDHRMRKGPSMFRKVLNRVIMAGGDTDTNGAVAGAMLGAYLGLPNMPKDLIEGLHDRATLDAKLAALERLGG